MSAKVSKYKHYLGTIICTSYICYIKWKKIEIVECFNMRDICMPFLNCYLVIIGVNSSTSYCSTPFCHLPIILGTNQNYYFCLNGTNQNCHLASKFWCNLNPNLWSILSIIILLHHQTLICSLREIYFMSFTFPLFRSNTP